MSISREELHDLRVKYIEMARLREEDRAGNGGDPRPAMALLASRFPGALREIDELTMETIAARRLALAAAESDPSRVERWMVAVSHFHVLTRGALVAKKWLSGRKSVDASTRDAFLAASVTLRYPADARAWAEDLARIAEPPRGKITDLVYERIAVSLEISPAEAKVLVFGPPRRERSGMI